MSRVSLLTAIMWGLKKGQMSPIYSLHIGVAHQGYDGVSCFISKTPSLYLGEPSGPNTYPLVRLKVPLSGDHYYLIF